MILERETAMYNFHHDPRIAVSGNRWLCGVILVLSLLVAGIFVTSSAAIAQDTSPATTKTVTADEINEVAREIWCPLCSGVRLDSCELKACDQMKDIIAIKLGEGEDTQSIVDYFVEQYGPQVLGAPPLEGFNWFAWILPFAVLIGGGVFLWMRSRELVRPLTAEAIRVETVSHERVTKSEYEGKLEEELKRYG
jgi:cytochrome c-type biogenesis protein CcmH